MKKIALITGAAGGIGSAIARKIILEIDTLVLFDINKDKLMRIENDLMGLNKIPVITYICDVGNSNQVNQVLESIVKKIGAPNVLINNAGIGGPFHRIDEVSDEEWFSIMNANLKSVFNLSRFLLPYMKENKYGKIINIASVQGYLGAKLSSTYTASKHGVIGYTRAIAAEWGQFGINCNAICPGYVDTSMGIQPKQVDDHLEKVIAKTPMARIAKPDEVANLVSYLAQDESSFINGSTITIDGGLTCHTGI